MDLEHSVLDNGIGYGYKFEQTDDEATFLFSFDNEVIESEFSVNYNNETNKVEAKRGDELLLAGTLFGGANSEPTTKCESNVFSIKFEKLTPGPWPVPIVVHDNDEVDGKSAFLFALFNDSKKNNEMTWHYMQISADLHYIPAQLFLADVYATKENPFTEQDLLKAIAILRDVYQHQHDDNIATKLATYLVETNQFIEADSILKGITKESDEVSALRAKVADVLSSLQPEQEQQQQPEEEKKIPFERQLSEPLLHEVLPNEVVPQISDTVGYSLLHEEENPEDHARLPLQKTLSNAEYLEFTSEPVKPQISESIIQHTFNTENEEGEGQSRLDLKKELSNADYREFTTAPVSTEISESIEHGFDQLPLQKEISSPEFAEFLHEENEAPPSALAVEISDQKEAIRNFDDHDEHTIPVNLLQNDKIKYIVIGAGATLSTIIAVKLIKKLFSKK